MPVAAIVFDFDGVIANSEPLHLCAFQQVLAETGITVGREEYYERYLGFDDVGAFRAIGEARGRRWSERELATLVARKAVVFDSAIESGAVLFPTAGACVERLAARFPLGIASGALRHEIEAVLQATDLRRHIRFVVASGDTPRSKPAPDPYLLAAELHGLPPEACVAIEDSRWGIESALAAGLRCIGVTHSYPEEELATADRVVASLDEITVELVAGLEKGRR
jgi:beta-phosphoglucomutase-like phosphatase (HAD superfamily)